MKLVIVGHTKEKMDYVCSLIPEKHTPIRIFNGGDYENAVLTENSRERDIGMYTVGLSYFPEEDTFTFINDDVKYLGQEFWKEVDSFDGSTDIIGVANLSSWVPYDRCTKVELDRALNQGRELRFIRTSAFISTRICFQRLWKEANGNPQKIEKSTIKYHRYKLIPPSEAYDSNIEKFI